MTYNLSFWIKYLLFLMFVLAIPSSYAEVRTTYFYTDVTGSPIVAVNEQGDVIWRAGRQPFGAKIVGQGIQSHRFPKQYTGHVADKKTGLTYMGARYYHPHVGRFYTPDPVGVASNNPFSFNRYAYANNNPYRYVDPDGAHPFLKITDVLFTIGDMSQAGSIGQAWSIFVDDLVSVPGTKTLRKASKLGAGIAKRFRGKATKGKAFAKGVNPKSVKQFGHTFSTHGAGVKNTRKLQGRAAGTGQSQGQFLDNQKAADFLSQHSALTKATDINLPSGLGQIIRPDGSISAATKVRIVPNGKGGFRSAFPVD